MNEPFFFVLKNLLLCESLVLREDKPRVSLCRRVSRKTAVREFWLASEWFLRPVRTCCRRDLVDQHCLSDVVEMHFCQRTSKTVKMYYVGIDITP